jgi:hypothetical protein
MLIDAQLMRFDTEENKIKIKRGKKGKKRKTESSSRYQNAVFFFFSFFFVSSNRIHVGLPQWIYLTK